VNTDKTGTSKNEFSPEVKQFRDYMGPELCNIDFAQYDQVFDDMIGIKKGMSDYQVVQKCLKMQMMGYDTAGDGSQDLDSDNEGAMILPDIYNTEFNKALKPNNVGEIKEKFCLLDRRLYFNMQNNYDVKMDEDQKTFLEIVDKYTKEGLLAEVYRKELLAIAVTLSLEDKYKVMVFNYSLKNEVSLVNSLKLFFKICRNSFIHSNQQ